MACCIGMADTSKPSWVGTTGTVPIGRRAMLGPTFARRGELVYEWQIQDYLPLVRSSSRTRRRRRRVTDMGKFSQKLKSMLMHDDLSDIPGKQIHRWENEGGAIQPTPKQPRRYIRRRVRGHDRPA